MSTRRFQVRLAGVVAAWLAAVAVVSCSILAIRGDLPGVGVPGSGVAQAGGPGSQQSTPVPTAWTETSGEPAPSAAPARAPSQPTASTSPRPPAATLAAESARTGTVQGEAFTSSLGVKVAAHPEAGGGRAVGYIADGDWVRYEQVSLEEVTSVNLTVATPLSGAVIEVRAGTADGPVLGGREAPVTGGWTIYGTMSIPLQVPAKGPLVLTFSGNPDVDLVDVDSLSLVRD
ncbi:MAG: carbohydrate-binding protein [Dermatophilaceae bacterium]